MKGRHEFVNMSKPMPIREIFVWVSIRIGKAVFQQHNNHASYIHPQRQRFHWIVSR